MGKLVGAKLIIAECIKENQSKAVLDYGKFSDLKRASCALDL